MTLMAIEGSFHSKFSTGILSLEKEIGRVVKESGEIQKKIDRLNAYLPAGRRLLEIMDSGDPFYSILEFYMASSETCRDIFTKKLNGVKNLEKSIKKIYESRKRDLEEKA